MGAIVPELPGEVSGRQHMNLPGFIDLQVNGYAGVDFNDPETTEDEILEAAETLAERGTAGFLATVITNRPQLIEQNIATVANAIKKQGKNGHILGIHLEGPFISPEYGYRGAHPEAPIRPPDLQWFQRLRRIAEGNLCIVTLAPEYENAVDFIGAVAQEVTVSVGHSNCSFKDVQGAVAAGLTMATHVGNGCRQTIDRHNNPIINILACTDLALSFIPDGFHLPEAFIRMLVACRPIEKLIAVSDSVRLAGMPPGRYTKNGTEILLREDGRLYLASDEDVMAGSSANMLQCMNHLASLGILTEQELWQVGYANPLRILGIRPEEFARCGRTVCYDVRRKRFEVRD